MSPKDPCPADEAFITDEGLLPHLPGHNAPSLPDDELLNHLERVARAQAAPPCRVCGSKLMVVAIGGHKSTVWACPNALQPAEGHLTWKARQLLRDHYNISQWVQYREENSYILELVERFRELKANAPTETSEASATAN